MNRIIAISVITFLIAVGSKCKACDAGKASITPIRVTVDKTQVDIPFEYRDCVAPATVSFTVVTQKKSSTFSVRVTDIVSGYVYLLDPYRTISTTFAFPPLPAAGHAYVVSLYEGARGKIGADVYAK